MNGSQAMDSAGNTPTLALNQVIQWKSILTTIIWPQSMTMCSTNAIENQIGSTTPQKLICSMNGRVMQGYLQGGSQSTEGISSEKANVWHSMKKMSPWMSALNLMKMRAKTNGKQLEVRHGLSSHKEWITLMCRRVFIKYCLKILRQPNSLSAQPVPRKSSTTKQPLLM